MEIIIRQIPANRGGLLYKITAPRTDPLIRYIRRLNRRIAKQAARERSRHWAMWHGFWKSKAGGFVMVIALIYAAGAIAGLVAVASSRLSGGP